MPGLKCHLRVIRTVVRLARTGLHLLWAVAIVATAFHFLSRGSRRTLKARWSLQLLEMLGVRLRCEGAPAAAGLLVANHISWLDIYAINALVPTSFVAKDEVRTWPLIGWLSTRAETIFVQRGSRAAAMGAKDQLVDQLRQQTCVGLFPEGTTSEGDSVLPFHSALFQSAIDAGVPVMPVAVRYTDSDGRNAAAPVYVGQTSLWQCLCAIVAEDALTVHIAFLPAIDCGEMTRRELAQKAHRRVVTALGTQPVSSTSRKENVCTDESTPCCGFDAQPHALAQQR